MECCNTFSNSLSEAVFVAARPIKVVPNIEHIPGIAQVGTPIHLFGNKELCPIINAPVEPTFSKEWYAWTIGRHTW
jgi:hypothetical protein